MEIEKHYTPIRRKLNIILAEDDSDDRLLFEEALDELPTAVKLITFNNGDDLMKSLNRKKGRLPDALFLDLNMPRKNGFAALGEIKRNDKLKKLPVIIFSTTANKEMINQVFKDAAHYYIQKPSDFGKLKDLLHKSLELIEHKHMDLPLKERFMITAD